VRTILSAGFVFWGLFLVFGLIVAAYLVWMTWEEGRVTKEASTESGTRDEANGGGVE
jgi:hypothetical protein